METELCCYLCEATILKAIPEDWDTHPVFCNWECFDYKVKELFKADIARKLGRD